MIRRGAAALAIVAAVGCEAETLDPIVIDGSVNCASVEVRVALADLDGGAPFRRVIRAMSDDPHGTRAWLLVERETAGGSTRLALEHIDGDVVDAEVLVDLAPALAPMLSLVPGSKPGELWALERGTAHLQVAHLDANAIPPLLAQSVELGWFPYHSRCDENGDGQVELCDTSDWPRELVVLEGRPYIVSIPPHSIDLTMYILFAELAGDQLSPVNLQEEQFGTTCPMEQFVDPNDLAACEAALAERSWRSIEWVGLRADATSSSTWILMRREEVGEDDIPLASDIALLEMRHDMNGLADLTPPRCIGLTSAACDPMQVAVPSMGPPTGLAMDRSSRYALHATSEGPPRLWQFASTDIELVFVDIQQDVELIQLDRDFALGRVVGGEWEINKVFPDAPERSEITRHGAAVTTVTAAGPGSFLVHDAGGPDLVHVVCSD